MSEHFDLIAIGGGSGGIAVCNRAALHGAKVALIEADRIGGTCVNRGCIPKKLLWHAAEIAATLRDAPDYGFSVSGLDSSGLNSIRPDWQKLKQSRDDYISWLNDIYKTRLDDNRVSYFAAAGRFVDERTIEVDGQRISADHIVIATGSRPLVPDIPGADLGITSDGFFALDAQPERIAIVGAGYIAVEIAGLMNALGSEVTMLLRREQFMRSFDVMIRKTLMEQMQDQGVNILTSISCGQITQAADKSLTLETSAHTLTGFDCLIWATGRAPLTDGLALDCAGVDLDERGFISTDDYQNTNINGIYALGDVTGRAALTPVAIAAGRKLADRLFAGKADSRLDYDLIPTVVFSHPTIGTIGMTEDEARDIHGAAIKVYQNRFLPLKRGLTQVKSRTHMKLITVGVEERIIGCHIIGDGADEMLQGFAVAIKMGATKQDFDNTVAIHPTSAEELVTMR